MAFDSQVSVNRVYYTGISFWLKDKGQLAVLWSLNSKSEIRISKWPLMTSDLYSQVVINTSSTAYVSIFG